MTKPSTQDGTSVDFLFKAGATDIDFNAAIGPVGAMIENGSITVDDGDGDFARFTLGLGDDDNNRRHFFEEFTELGSLSLDDLEISSDGQASANLPIRFPGLEAIPFLPNVLDVAGDVADFADGFDASDLSFSFDTGSLSNVVNALRNPADFNALALVGGWDGALDLLIEAMEGELFGIKLPFIGDKLKEQASFLRDIKEGVSDNLADNATAGTGVDAIRSDLMDALGPARINLLKDLNTDGQITIDDIGIIPIDDFLADDPNNPGLGFEIVLGQDLLTLDLPIDFDLGIPGLGLDIDAAVNANLGFELASQHGCRCRPWVLYQHSRFGAGSVCRGGDSRFGGGR